MRKRQPTSNHTLKRTSAAVAMMAAVAVSSLGRKNVSLPVEVTKDCQSPHAMFAPPGGPHQPKRSATADRKAAARVMRNDHWVRTTGSDLFIDDFTPQRWPMVALWCVQAN